MVQTLGPKKSWYKSLDGPKILLRGLGSFSRPGKPILRKSFFHQIWDPSPPPPQKATDKEFTIIILVLNQATMGNL